MERQRPSLVVGLGASAGGIHALNDFFAHVSPDSGGAFVVILHLSPDHESRLAEVLQATAPIPVSRVAGRVTLEPNHAYVVSPNTTLSVVDDHIVVADVTRTEQRRAPVDLFFRTLADAHGSRSVAVVLSGTGPDGSAGLKRVKEYGGLTIAQDPNEAEYGDMPRNAIATRLVDLVLPIAEMPARIAAYGERLRSASDGDDASGEVTAADDAEAMREVLALLRIRTGHDFSNYKPATLHRRVQRRINVRGLSGATGYARMIRESPDEAVALMKELLISVTQFFRDTTAFAALSERVLPRLFDSGPDSDQVRVWVPGCASGEEAYSIAILLAEHASAVSARSAIQVFASDIDDHAIAVAREGFYTEAEVADVSEERLLRFFQREPAGYRVRRDLRETVLFAHHNAIRDPPFSHLDLISCRNLLIYLNRTAQERMMETFHFALRPGRYLFLGTSESTDGSSDLFLTLDKDAHIYESRMVATRPGRHGMDRALPAARIPHHKAPEMRIPDRIAPADLHQRLLEQYAPPSLVVTEEGQVVHMSARVGRYLQVSGGEPSGDLMRVVRPELRADLHIAIQEAARLRASVEAPAVRLAIEGVERAVTMTVRPALRDADPTRGFLLVVFDEGVASEHDRPVPLTASGNPASARLEEEIVTLKMQLRMTIEQYETQVEETKASNEELQAMNEELRSSAEELETSKEELQSVNEELTTVNQELKIKIDELGVSNNNFQNLINSSDVGTIFLDRSLRVRLFTPAAREIFNLQDSDIGRSLSDITSRVRGVGLHEVVRRVLQDLSTIDREVETRDGRWHLLRIRPYRTTDDRIEGVVITFQDITDRLNAERRVRQSEEKLRLLIDSAIDYAILTTAPDGVIEGWNSGAQRMFGYSADEIVGKPFDLLFTPEDRAAGIPALELQRAARDGRAPDEREHVRKDGGRFYCSGVTTRLDPTGGLGFAKIARDLTEQRNAARALGEAHANLERRVDERTGELHQQVRDRTAAQEHASELLRKLVSSQEEERARIARDLHDQIGQQLTALRLTLERLAQAHEGNHHVSQAAALARNIDSELGFIAWELRPAVLDDLGLAAALPRFVQSWSEHYGVRVEYRGSGSESGQLPREAEVAFYRIAQESLNNIAKHAHASRVDVMLDTRAGSVVLVVEDDGVGFDVSAAHSEDRGIGLLGMKERADLVGATLNIESEPGKGTSIFLRRPVGSADAAGTP